RDASGRVHLKQAIGSGLRHALHSEFWRRLIDHIPRYGSRPPPSDRTPGLGLECAFAREVAANLKPNTSLLLLLLRTSEPRALLDGLGRHRGRVLQCDLAGTVCQTLASALAGPPAAFPSAAELREMVIKADEERLLARRRRRDAAENERIRWIEQLRNETLSPSQLQAMTAAVREAARGGKREAWSFASPASCVRTADGPSTITSRPGQIRWLDNRASSTTSGASICAPRATGSGRRSSTTPVAYRVTSASRSPGIDRGRDQAGLDFGRPNPRPTRAATATVPDILRVRASRLAPCQRTPRRWRCPATFLARPDRDEGGVAEAGTRRLHLDHPGKRLGQGLAPGALAEAGFGEQAV